MRWRLANSLRTLDVGLDVRIEPHRGAALAWMDCHAATRQRYGSKAFRVFRKRPDGSGQAVSPEYPGGLSRRPFVPIRIGMAAVPFGSEFPDLFNGADIALGNAPRGAPIVHLRFIAKHQHDGARVDHIVPCVFHRDREVDDKVGVDELAALDPDGRVVVERADSCLDGGCAARQMSQTQRAPRAVAPPRAGFRSNHAGGRCRGEWMRNPNLVRVRVEYDAVV